MAPFRLLSETIGAPHKAREGTQSQTLVFTLEPQLPGDYQLTFLSIPFAPEPNSSEKPVELLSGLYPIQSDHAEKSAGTDRCTAIEDEP